MLALIPIALLADPPGIDSTAGKPPPQAVAVTASYPDDPRLDEALRMMSKGAFEAAATTASTVVRSKPDVDRAQAILGVALNKLKNYEGARTALEKADASKQEFPERRHVPHFLGWCCFHLGDLEAARKAFEEHLRRMPGEPDSTFGLGLVALGEDRLDDADKLFAEALDGFTKPKPRPTDQARVLTRMADLALRRNDAPKAEELLERSIKASALQHETWSKLARVKDRLGKPQEADAARANVQRILEALGRGEKAPTSDSAPPGASPGASTVPEVKK